MGKMKGVAALASRKFSNPEKICWPSRDALEQATPEAVAFYRAKRLKCRVAVDLCCGIGIDSIALAKNCEKVYAIELDESTISCAEKNAKAYGIKNIEFIHADCFDVDLKKLNADVAFADPSRRIFARRVKELSKTRPNTIKLIKFIQRSGLRNFCIEASRELFPEEIPFECEREYISLAHELNCATLYFGSLARCKRSAVVLPSEQRVESNELKQRPFSCCNAPQRFLYELDESIARARLQAELLEKMHPKAKILSEDFFTSQALISSPFFANTFRLLKETRPSNLDDALKELGAGKVVLRGRFLPELQILAKRDIEAKLSGTKKLHVIDLSGRFFICEKIQ